LEILNNTIVFWGCWSGVKTVMHLEDLGTVELLLVYSRVAEPKEWLLAAATCADLDHFGMPRLPITPGTIAKVCQRHRSSTIATQRSAEIVRFARDTAKDQEVFQASAGRDTSAMTCSNATSATTPTRGD
jgi:hypothetical protein